jgi:hypothetical protein
MQEIVLTWHTWTEAINGWQNLRSLPEGVLLQPYRGAVE